MTEKPNLFIGVDGGGTKTLVRLEDSRGNLLGEGKSGTANVRLSVEMTWESILGALGQALRQANLPLDPDSYDYYVGCGLAGTQVPDARQRFLDWPHPFTQLVVESDGYTSCLGAHDGEDGEVISIGTGVIAYRIEGEQVWRIGGWGFPQGDEGSGAWLGLEAIRLTLQWQDGRIPASPLVEAVFAHFDRDFSRMLLWANRAQSSHFAQIAPFVIQQAKEGDSRAIALMTQAAAEIDKIGAALANKGSQILPCSLLGGVSPFLEPLLSETLRSRLIPAKYNSVRGAIILIRRAIEKQKD
ncbi:BadF/BadG/BcrA/BcrD ATPase family protein [Oscillatoria sp. FACHB-1406]|uniref:BadF/BadG/BcrA/BcrD ATPase family protein n=1 Tax=Oscillatoria sp. FACHB-1406 TaxID=2692846 RepID=UPI0016871282|nr:ATPase [Oscillatoria sp. FACHB-1406]